MNEFEKMANERSTRWVNASQALSKIEPFMIVAAQGLGRLDVKLIQSDQRFCELVPSKSSTIKEALRLTDHMGALISMGIGSI